MSRKIKEIKIKGLLDVNGVVNFAGKSDYYNAKKGKNYENWISSKKFIVKSEDGVYGVDYTSHNCLRWALFKEEMPHQPKMDDHKDMYERVLATPSGLLRGGMSTQGKNSDTIKKSSPLTVLDAMTLIQDKKQLTKDLNGINSTTVVEVMRNSTPIEIKENDDDKSGTSFYYKDNSAPRKQNLDITLRLIELQFIGADQNNKNISPKKVGEFLDSLKDTCVRLLGEELNHELKSYNLISDAYKTTKRGILLDEKLQKALIKHLLGLVLDLSVSKAGSSLSCDRNSLKVEVNFSKFENTEEMSISELVAKLDSGEFEIMSFYKEVPHVDAIKKEEDSTESKEEVEVKQKNKRTKKAS